MAIKNYMINDKWLDIAKQNIVEVESTDGVIGSVKVNGQEYGGGGSSDFSTAEVTVVNSTAMPLGIEIINIDGEENKLVSGQIVNRNTTKSVNAVLYDGSQYYDVYEISGTITVSGNAEYDAENSIITITGDCTITIS